MAWTAPMTAVTGNVFTAAEFNTNVRDNLLETAPAKATTDGGYFVAAGTNSINQRLAATAQVLTRESRANTSYGNLSTPGPAVTVTTGTTALVMIGCQLSVNTGGTTEAIASYSVSGATTIAASDDWCLKQEGTNSLQELRFGDSRLVTGLNPGSNTFTMEYKSGTNAATCFFEKRRITVVPF